MNIAIMGGSSHIAKNLIVRFAATPSEHHLTLFCRSAAPVEEFVRKFTPGKDIKIIDSYKNFNSGNFDVIINCVGAGTPGTKDFSPRNWFSTLQYFDDLALDYLKERNPDASLITFSSGGIYGPHTPGPFTKESLYNIPVNAVESCDYYAISRLYAEAKHRSLSELHITDLRIFSFFSRFIRLDSGYFMSDLLDAVSSKKKMQTSPEDMIRDYIAPDDLFSAVKLCIEKRGNNAFDVRSAAPAGKFEILNFFKKKFDLEWQYSEVPPSPNGTMPIYCSDYDNFEQYGFHPRFTSLEGLIAETEKYILQKDLF